VLGFLVQVTILGLSYAFAGKPTTEFDTGLTDGDRSLLSGGRLFGHNLLHVRRIALVLALPHGSLEFGALLLPLIAASWPRRSETRARVRQIRRALPLALGFLLLAAFVEC
jgi:hypothetical protein